MNSTAQHSLSPLVQYNQVISSCFLYSIYGKPKIRNYHPIHD